MGLFSYEWKIPTTTSKDIPVAFYTCLILYIILRYVYVTDLRGQHIPEQATSILWIFHLLLVICRKMAHENFQRPRFCWWIFDGSHYTAQFWSETVRCGCLFRWSFFLCFNQNNTIAVMADYLPNKLGQTGWFKKIFSEARTQTLPWIWLWLDPHTFSWICWSWLLTFYYGKAPFGECF